ncbi:MAG: prepilin-type N-terminal cleavage/methylation domain-containing protein [Candidatus Methylomirabilales bacterium]
MQRDLSMKCLVREKRGFTLLEVLFAVVIITVAVLAVVGLFPTALRNVRYGGHMSQASSLAQEMIEMIRTQPFVTIQSYNNLDTGVAPTGLPPTVLTHYRQWCRDIVHPDPAWCAPSAVGNPGGALPGGQGTILVAQVAGLPDLWQVAVTVTWQEQGSQTITLVTYVARYA